MRRIAQYLPLALALLSCATQQSAVQPSASVPEPPVIVYATRADYTDRVPIALTPDRRGVASYPAPTDITEEQRPLPIADGYLLDRRGVGANVAFTSYTYAQYSQLPAPPTADELLASVIDSAPLRAMYQCPSRHPDSLRHYVATGFSGCRAIVPERKLPPKTMR